MLGAVAAAMLLAICATARLALGSPVGSPAELQAHAIALPTASGSTIRGWFAPGRPGAGAVLLLHGLGSSSLDMLGRARFLVGAGFGVLLIDFRGHGESTAALSTYGGLESRDARAAVEFLRTALPGERIGVIGISMGGAAALLGPSPLPIHALVLESVYPTIEEAFGDRLRTWLGPLGRALSPVVMATLFPRDGVTPAELRPIDRIHEQRAPVFVLAGAADRYTTLRESQALFAQAREPKALWIVEGAGHVDLHAYAGAEYERRVGDFLARELHASDGSRPAAGGGADRGPRAQPEDDAQRAVRGDHGAQRDGREE